MIKSAKEFIQLRASSELELYLRAAHESASLDVWKQVIAERPDMKRWVAHDQTVPIEILQILVADQDPAIRSAVAAKNKLPPELMALLAGDSESSVRQRIVYNKNVSRSLLEQLANDPEGMIAIAARKRLLGFSE